MEEQRMQTIAVIGHGNIGGTLAARLAAAGHAVTFGARNPGDEKAQAASRARGVPVASIADAVGSADVVIVATPGKVVADLAASLGSLAGKLVID
ncbi:MAG TPA: NAD(P)-binding domain-containing protein, partial [Gemmatimonadaceae bacterium]|nr:NAD(P)-binding domain-containing protein [Gemmatimonadaceae bacterium]